MEAIEARFQDPEAELDTLFAEIQGSYKVQIKREEPPWAAGTCGTHHFDKGETISTDWIAERFGGQKFQIRVMDANGTPLGSRRIRIPKVPREDGIELVRGPNGPITIEEAKKLNPPPPPAPPQNDGMNGLIKGVLEMQTQQANQMQTLMMTLLTKMLEPNAQAQPIQQQFQPPVDPQAQLKNTLETFKLVEEMREMFGGGGGEGEGDGDLFSNPLFEKLIDRFAGPPPQQHYPPPQQNRALPPGPIAPPEPDDLQLMAMVANRLKQKSPEEQMKWGELLSRNLEQGTPETRANAGQDENEDLESLLTDEDLAELENDSQSEETNDPTYESEAF